MIASWLLKAKTLPPRQLVAIDARDRLIDRLKVGRTRKVTLLEAPAGFGKTTLLAQWREMLLAERTRVAWLTLDRDDTGDRLVAYIAFALQEAGVDMAATGFLSDDRRGSPTGALALHSLLEAAAQDGHAVLPDLRRPGKNDGPGRATPARYADQLRARQPAHCHRCAHQSGFVPCAPCRSRGLVNRIDATSLRFTPDEMTAFLEKASPALDVRTAMARAEGWPVALQILRAVAMRAEDSGEVMGGERLPEGLAASYFTEQLVHGLAPHQLAFLRDISLLDEVSLALADFARDASDSAHILRELEYLSALIPPLEGADGVVRLHPMLREHFATLAGADPARCALINRQAAQWFASARKLPTALRYAVASGDKMLTGTLIVEAGGVLIWIRRGMSEVVAADKLIDDEMIAAMPPVGTDAYHRSDQAIAIARGSCPIRSGRRSHGSIYSGPLGNHCRIAAARKLDRLLDARDLLLSSAQRCVSASPGKRIAWSGRGRRRAFIL
jgi:LuxR family maltose regulon positive regulatory protein